MKNLNNCQYKSYLKEFENPWNVSEKVRIDDYFKESVNYDKI